MFSMYLKNMMILWISLCECSLLYNLELKINEYFLRYLKVRRHIEIKKGQIRTIRWMPCKFLIGSSVKIAIIWHGAERRHGRTFWDCFVKCFSDMSSLIFSKRKNKYTLNILFFFLWHVLIPELLPRWSHPCLWDILESLILIIHCPWSEAGHVMFHLLWQFFEELLHNL